MASKKILFVITKSNWGGAQRYVYDLAVALPKDKYEVVVAFGDHGPLAEKLKQAHIRTITLAGISNEVSPFILWRAYQTLKNIFREEKPDIIHLNSSLIGLAGALAGRSYTTIFTAHGWVFNEQRNLITKLVFRFIHWLTVLLCTKTIAVSQAIYNDIVGLPGLEKKLVVIRSGLTAISFHPKTEARQEIMTRQPRLAAYEEDLWLGTIAELHPTKGYIFALKAIQQLIKQHPNLRYVIIGEGKQRVELEKLIKNLNLDNNVFLLGFIPDASSLLKAFDIFLLSSISEALAYVILEAGQTGLPIVATRVGGIPEIITHNHSGLLVLPRNPIAIAEAINLLLNDQQLRSKLAAQAQAKIEADFSFERQLRETLACY